MFIIELFEVLHLWYQSMSYLR